MSAADIAAAEHLPAAPAPAGHCAVPGCECKPTVRRAVLCEPHAAQFRNRWTPVPLEQFLSDRWVRPLPPLPPCLVSACTRTADGAVGYCNTHYQRWRVAQRGSAEVDERWWRLTEPCAAEPGQVNLRALPTLIVVEVLSPGTQSIDTGDKLGFLKATVEFALARPDLGQDFHAYLKSLNL